MHDAECEADWGQTGQESPCRCAERQEAVKAVLRAAQEYVANSGPRMMADGYTSYVLGDDRPLRAAVARLNEVGCPKHEPVQTDSVRWMNDDN